MKLLPDIDKHGTISSVLTPGQQLMVQIVKEPISSKGPRLTTEISLTGRYIVLMPFNDKISISQKIKNPEEKARLRQLVDSIRPKNFGVIIRTSAEGKRVAELNHEMKTLLKYWEDTVAKARTATAPALIFQEESRIVSVIRDIFNPDFESIWVNDRETFTQIQNYVNLIAPDRKDIVKFYDKDQPIFDAFNITKQIKTVVRQNRIVQKRCLHYHRAHRSPPRNRRELRQPLQGYQRPGNQRPGGKFACCRRDCPATASARHGRHHCN